MNQIDLMLEPVRTVLIQFGAFLPRLLLAIIILLIGWLLAKALRVIVLKGLKAINFQVLSDRAGIDRFLQKGGMQTDTPGILGGLVYWLAMLVVLMIAFNSLGMAHVTELIGRIMLFIPKIIVAVLILAFGAYFARFIDNSIITYGKNVGLEDTEFLGRVARYAILVFVVMIALEQVDVASELVRQSFLIILAGVVLALALAFGLGSRERVAALLDKWWPQHRSDPNDKK
jgi:hypothetical protein